jgi:flagella basal body P-ring formation protein FlgA
MRPLPTLACTIAAIAGSIAGAELLSRRHPLSVTAHAAAPGVDAVPAADAIRAAILERVGASAEVTIHALEPLREGRFREARPDPLARLGRPVQFTLIPESGAPVKVVASFDVVADHATTVVAIGRGHTIDLEDLTPRRAALRDVPMRLISSAAMLAGARALRPIPAGALVQTSFVAMRRAIEPGDPVTAVAIAGPIEVSATLVAADGGAIGATIRVVNPDTRRVIRGRIVGDGKVQVIR